MLSWVVLARMRAEAKLGRCQPTYLLNCRCRHAPPGHPLRNPVPEFGISAADMNQVEPANNSAARLHEYEVGVTSRLLLGQQLIVLVAEVLEEVVSTIGDRRGKVGSVRHLERQDRRAMFGPKALKLRRRQHRYIMSGLEQGFDPSGRRRRQS